MKLSVIIPVYNESRTVRALLERVAASPVEKEIIVVDDGSTDGTKEILRGLFPNGTPGVTLLFQEANQGKGAAVRAGLKQVQGDLVLIQDADLEYDPQNYPELIKPFSDPGVQVVYGSRFLHTNMLQFLWEWFPLGERARRSEKRYLTTYLGIRVLNFLSFALYGLRTTDEATCYKVLRTPLMKSLDLETDGFEFCSEVTAKIGRRRLGVTEVPITYHPRTFQEGKKLKIGRDGFGALWTLLKYRWRK